MKSERKQTQIENDDDASCWCEPFVSSLCCQFFGWWCWSRQKAKNAIFNWKCSEYFGIEWCIYLKIHTLTHGRHLPKRFDGVVWEKREDLCRRRNNINAIHHSGFIFFFLLLSLYLSVASYFNQKMFDCNRAPLLPKWRLRSTEIGLFCCSCSFSMSHSKRVIESFGKHKMCYIVDFLFLVNVEIIKLRNTLALCSVLVHETIAIFWLQYISHDIRLVMKIISITHFISLFGYCRWYCFGGFLCNSAHP